MFSNLLRPNKAMVAAAVVGVGAGTVSAYYKLYGRQGSTELKDWVNLWKDFAVQDESPPWDRGMANEAANSKFLHELYGLDDMPPIRRPIQIRIIRCFAPLCGASRDLKALNDYFQGLIKQQPKELQNNYKVKIIGVEASATAIDTFYDRECSGEYTIEYDLFTKIPIYVEKNYNLINADVFDPAMSRLVLAADCIYDVGSLSVIDASYRKEYIKFCSSVLTKNGNILLRTWNFDEAERRGDKPKDDPPYPLSREQVFQLYKEVLVGENENEKRQSLVLLDSQDLKESTDPWLKGKLDEFGVQHGSLDLYLIKGNDAKVSANDRVIRA